MKRRTDVDLIISGGLWWNDTKGKAHSLNLLIADGKQNNEGRYSRYGLRTFKNKSYEFNNYKYVNDLYGMLGGSPALIVDGKIKIDTVGMESSLIKNRHPRAGVGMDDNYFYLVTIDGRQKGKIGATISEFANVMLNIGCKYAIGGDGGGTVRLEDKKGSINSPTENRPSHNGIGVKLKEI